MTAPAPEVIAIGNGRAWRALRYLCRCDPSSPTQDEEHRGETISWVRSGSFDYQLEGRTYQVTPGALLLGTTGRTYRCSHPHSAGDECWIFEFAPGTLGEIAGRRWRVERPVLPPVPKVEALFRAPLSAEELGLEIAGAVAEVAIDRPLPEIGSSSRDRDRAREAVERIEGELAEPLSLEELAAGAALSPFHFLRVFRREIGATPHQYLIAARLRRAVELLFESPRSITEIALEVGFEDLSNFTRTFKKHLGRSPRALRRSGLGGLSGLPYRSPTPDARSRCR